MALSSIYSQKPSLLITIHQCKEDLTLITRKINALQNLEDNLRKSINILSDEEWKSKIKEITEIKAQIEQISQKYYDNSLLLTLKRKLKRRLKKRTHVKKLKIRKQENFKNREKLHKKIDDWIKNEKHKDLEILENEENAKYTEFMLSGVTKRIINANRYIQLLNSLKELRRLRKIAASAQYQQSTDFYEKKFELKIDQLIKVWMDALNEYEIEKRNLQSLLNNKTKSTKEQWAECLFGSYSLNETIQLKSEQNLDDFLDIRFIWDSYIVPDPENYSSLCSSIPTGWVFPNENPSDQWALYRYCSDSSKNAEK